MKNALIALVFLGIMSSSGVQAEEKRKVISPFSSKVITFEVYQENRHDSSLSEVRDLTNRYRRDKFFRAGQKYEKRLGKIRKYSPEKYKERAEKLFDTGYGLYGTYRDVKAGIEETMEFDSAYGSKIKIKKFKTLRIEKMFKGSEESFFKDTRMRFETGYHSGGIDLSLGIKGKFW